MESNTQEDGKGTKENGLWPPPSSTEAARWIFQAGTMAGIIKFCPTIILPLFIFDMIFLGCRWQKNVKFLHNGRNYQTLSKIILPLLFLWDWHDMKMRPSLSYNWLNKTFVKCPSKSFHSEFIQILSQSYKDFIQF